MLLRLQEMFQNSVDYAHTDLLILLNSNDSTVIARIGEAVLASNKNQASLTFFRSKFHYSIKSKYLLT